MSTVQTPKTSKYISLAWSVWSFMQTSPCPDDRLYLALSKNDGRPPLQTTGKTKLETMINHLFLSFSHHFVGFPMVFPWVMGYFSMVFPADHLVPGGSCCASRSLARSSRRWDWWCWRALGSGTEGAKDPLVLWRKCENIWIYRFSIWLYIYIWLYILCISYECISYECISYECISYECVYIYNVYIYIYYNVYI